MSSGWWFSSSSKPPKDVESPAVHETIGTEPSAPVQEGVVTQMTFEEVLRRFSPEIAQHYDPNEPRKALVEAIEDAEAQTNSADQLANMASEAGSGSDLAKEAAAAAVAAEYKQSNVRRLAAALEEPPTALPASWGPNSTSWSPNKSPYEYQPRPPTPPSSDVTINTWNLPKPSYDAGSEVAIEDASTSHPPPHVTLGAREDGGPRSGYPTPRGNRHGGIEEVPVERLPVHHGRGGGGGGGGGLGHSQSEDSMLLPLIRQRGRQEFARWKRAVGWGETLAGCSTLDDTRLASLDVFRGITIAGLILVVDSGAHFPVLAYSPWAGGPTLGDLTDPFLLFSVGVGIALAFKRVPSKSKALYKILLRALKLFLIGAIVQGGYFHGPTSLGFGVSLGEVRYWGILQTFIKPSLWFPVVWGPIAQRVSVGFFLVSLCEVAVMKLNRGPSQGFFDLIATFMLHWGVAVVLALTSLGLTYFLYVPDWTFTPPPSAPTAPLMLKTDALTVSCGVAGDMGPACNAAGFIDRLLFGLPHLDQLPTARLSASCTAADPPAWCQAPFEAWGLLSTLTSILTVFLGLHFGHILTHFKQHWVRLSHASVYSAALLAAGYGLQFPLTAELHKIWPDFPDYMVLHFAGIPFNRQLYSVSFLLFTAGIAGLVLCLAYLIADKMNVRFYTKLFEWIGKNTLLVFVLGACGVLEAVVRGVYWGSPNQNLVVLLQAWLYGPIQKLNYANLVGGLLKIVGWALLAGFFDYNGYSWKF